MCLTNNDLWLPNMVSLQTINKQTKNFSKGNAKENGKFKATRERPCPEIRINKIIDIIEYTLKQKWKWAGHTTRMKDNRWTKRCTE